MQQIRKIAIIILPLIVIFSFVVVVNLAGVDFGYQWEQKNMTGFVNQYLRTGSLLPGWYNYPPMVTYVELSATIPYAVPYVLHHGFDLRQLRQYLLDDVVKANFDAFVLNIRKVFVGVTALALVWEYLGVYAVNKRAPEAFFAAAFLGLSWELTYQARWIAPHTVMMQFGALTVMFIMLAMTREKNKKLWIILAGVAAGLATATKYPAGLLLLPVGAAAFFVTKEGGLFNRSRILLFLGIGLAFVAAYLLVAPGTLLEFDAFMSAIRYEMTHYSKGHGQQTVVGGWPHLILELNYFARVLFSAFQPLAVLIFSMSLVGMYAYLRENRDLGITLVSFPVVYVAYFSLQNVMFVSNMVLIMPFLAVFAARGVMYIFMLIPVQPARFAWIGLFAIVVIVNSGWLVYTVGTLQDRNTDRFVKEFVAFVDAAPEETFYVTEQVKEAVTAVDGQTRKNISTELSSEVDWVVFYFYEDMRNPGYWPVNKPGIAPKAFGPLDINLDYYASWQGDDRILLTTVEHARRIGVIFNQ
ncbi:MAG: glycosyltransferase family 39 protein [Anaerolineales bacterium]|nr:glycosyltransferase family 39 protein [Anaerolineales bacterium]